MMRFFELTRLFGITRNGHTRIRRLLLFAFLSLFLLIASSITTGLLVRSELNTVYSENYNTLKEAGFSDVITSPSVVQERIDFLLLLVPLIGIGFTLPLWCFAVSEICAYEKDMKNKRKETTSPKKAQSV